MPTSFSSALRTSRFNDIPSLIDFRTARFSAPYFLYPVLMNISSNPCLSLATNLRIS
jgi:hypothetical protein